MQWPKLNKRQEVASCPLQPAFVQDLLSISQPGLQVWPLLAQTGRPTRIHTDALDGSTDRCRARAVDRPQPMGLNGERTSSPCSRPSTGFLHLPFLGLVEAPALC